MKEIVEELKSYNLKDVPIERVKETLHKIGKLPAFAIKIDAGQYIVRSRNSHEWVNFEYPKNISYISEPSIIPKIGRANAHGATIFYGSIPFDIEKQNGNQVFAMVEASVSMSSNDEFEFEEYATLGKWRVIKDFIVIGIISHKQFIKKNKHLELMHSEFLEFLDTLKEKKEDYEYVTEYIASEFAKEVHQIFEYKISAAFSDILFARGFAGILFPSIKSEGEYFNLALPPDVVDNCLQLEKVAVWRIKKKGKHISMNPYLYSEALNNEGKFVWRDPQVPFNGPIS